MDTEKSNAEPAQQPAPKKRAWAFFKRVEIHNTKGELYLLRWILLRTPWFAVYLHKIVRSDEDRHLHDHPWNFLSLLLKGFYLEQTPMPEERKNEVLSSRYMTMQEIQEVHASRHFVQYHAPCFNYKRAEQLHRLDLPKVGEEFQPVWSLVFCGTRRRDWGFQTPEGWVSHNEYFDRVFGKGNWNDV